MNKLLLIAVSVVVVALPATYYITSQTGSARQDVDVSPPGPSQAPVDHARKVPNHGDFKGRFEPKPPGQ